MSDQNSIGKNASPLKIEVVHPLQLVVIFGTLSFQIAWLILWPVHWPGFLLVSVFVLITLISSIGTRAGYGQLAGIFNVWGCWLLLCPVVYLFGGVRSPVGAVFLVHIVFAYYVCSARQAVVMTVLSVAGLASIAAIESAGYLPPSILEVSVLTSVIAFIVFLCEISVIALMATTTIRQTTSRLEVANRALQHQTNSLEESNRSLLDQIHVRRETEKRLDESREEYRLLLENAYDAVFQLNEQGTIQYANPAAQRIFGLDPKTLTGMNIAQLLLELPNTEEGLPDWQAIHSGDPFAITCQNAEGEALHLNITSASFVKHDETFQILVMRDVTEQTKSRELLFHSQKMESLGLLAGGIAHDFNNCLHAISAYAESIRNGASDSDTQDRSQKITSIAINASNICDQLLAYSGSPSESVDLVDTHRIIDELQGLWEATLPKNLNLSLSLPADRYLFLGNESQIKRILMNLVSNAAEAIKPHRGNIDVSIEHCRNLPDASEINTSREHNGYLRIAVSDTGCGIPEDILDRVFDPYFSTRGNGHGFGLPVVQGITNAMGGSIELESIVGLGTHIVLTLPTRLAVSEEPDDSEISVRQSSQLDLLIVDDERAVLDSLSLAFAEFGWKVECSETGKGAVQAIENSPNLFDAILLDYTMPDLLGTEVVRQIRNLGSRIPIILCSGHLDDLLPESTKEMQPLVLIKKPCLPSELRERITEFVYVCNESNLADQANSPKVSS